MKTFKDVICSTCGKTHKKAVGEINQTKTGRFFCSRSCAATYNNRLKPKRQKQPPVIKIREKRQKLCSTCRIPLTTDNCYKSNKSSLCKKCFTQYCSNRWISLKKRAIEYKGGKCEDCQVPFSYELYDFHHLDPSKKEFVWPKLRYKNWEIIKQEVDKCALLCANCHRKRHLLFEEAFSPVSRKVKNNGFCQKCGIELTEGSMYRRRGKPDCLCKKCRNKGATERQRKRKINLVLKMGERCFDCKEKFDPRIYDMHHLVPSDKNKSIRFTHNSGDSANAEMEKCILLCPNCHRNRHIKTPQSNTTCCATGVNTESSGLSGSNR